MNITKELTQITLKVGYAFFQKCLRKRVGAEYQNKLVANQQQGACLLMMRGESAHQCTDEPSYDRKIEMADKRQKRKTSAE